MNEEFYRKLARRIKWSWLRKRILRSQFRKHGLDLEDLLSYEGDRYFHYKVDQTFIPNEGLHWPVSFETQLQKCRNESLYFYTPEQGDTIIDIGAGLGEESLVYSRLVAETGKVLSIEANPTVFRVLDKTIRLNNLTNTSAFQLAIANEDGSVALSNYDASYESGFIQSGDQIPSLRMDHFLEKHARGSIDLLKVNIEGAERFVVDTLSQPNYRRIRNMAIACHDFRYRKEGNEFFQTKEHVMSKLATNGFLVQTRNTGIDYLDDWVYAKANKIE